MAGALRNADLASWQQYITQSSDNMEAHPSGNFVEPQLMDFFFYLEMYCPWYINYPFFVSMPLQSQFYFMIIS